MWIYPQIIFPYSDKVCPQTFLFQDRDFEFTSTSDLDQLNFAHPAFRMLDASISYIKTNSAPPSDSAKSSSSRTRAKLEWMYSDFTDEGGTEGNETKTAPQKHSFSLQTMNEIITIMVLPSLTTPVVSGSYKRFLDMFYLTADLNDIVRPFPERPFKAFVRLYTNDFERARRRHQPNDVMHLAEAVNAGIFSRTSLLNTGDANADTQKRARELARINRLMDSWVYMEDAILAKCGLYVWLVMLGAGILVAGRLAIGVTLGDRLPNVDPFNITVYAWALAAFGVLICKAVMVENWSWSDFLHSCVKCRSVSELRAVTGINDQLIIAKILHDESESVLKTRGPYNAVFLRKTEDGLSGFSIDVPINNKTLLLSGLSMLKVETPLGHALVCLDTRKGTELSVVEHREVGTKTERLMCQNIDRLAQAAMSNGKRHVQLKLPLKTGELEWRKVEGVYNFLEVVFV